MMTEEDIGSGLSIRSSFFLDYLDELQDCLHMEQAQPDFPELGLPRNPDDDLRNAERLVIQAHQKKWKDLNRHNSQKTRGGMLNENRH